jgi:hypothetical protein
MKKKRTQLKRKTLFFSFFILKKKRKEKINVQAFFGIAGEDR